MSGNWSELNFTALQSNLDEQSTQIKQSQEESVNSRRLLTSQTKQFRKLSDEEKLGEIRQLMKNYQQEIDKLTARCKFAENSFMDVYRSLALLPDPSDLLKTQQSEIEAIKKDLQTQTDLRENSEHDSKLARELERKTLKIAQLQQQLLTCEKQAKTSVGADQSTINSLEDEVVKQKALNSKLQLEIQSKNQEIADQNAKLISLQNKQEIEPPKQLEETFDVKLKRELTLVQSKLAEETIKTGKLESEINNSRAIINQLEDELNTLNKSADTFSTISGWTAVPRNQNGERNNVNTIMNQQRERFKKRVEELEELKHKNELEITTLKKDMEKIKTEKQSLYERVRQLQMLVPNQAKDGSQLYDESNDSKLKELELAKRTQGMSKVHARLVEVFARGLVDERVRLSLAVYVGVLHLMVVYGLT